ncbi:unnamed protein product [Dimorphilus gyrociliatus]|uniref:Uncharacterized protein n=1 Tax=Dimorphilus gyrociliatus TaxID=2664684 RepID=A0A7I8VME3_9ANNE|nr:unnamed protein product [Dimorphilus gyrociliatus]
MGQRRNGTRSSLSRAATIRLAEALISVSCRPRQRDAIGADTPCAIKCKNATPKTLSVPGALSGLGRSRLVSSRRSSKVDDRAGRRDTDFTERRFEATI